jgi:hypothetical protein
MHVHPLMCFKKPRVAAHDLHVMTCSADGDILLGRDEDAVEVDRRSFDTNATSVGAGVDLDTLEGGITLLLSSAATPPPAMLPHGARSLWFRWVGEEARRTAVVSCCLFHESHAHGGVTLLSMYCCLPGAAVVSLGAGRAEGLARVDARCAAVVGCDVVGVPAARAPGR